MKITVFDSKITQPADKGIVLRDILQPENEVDEKYYLKDKSLEYVKKRILDKEKFCNLNPDKSRALQERYNESWNGSFISSELFNIYESGHQSGRVRGIEGKAQTLIAERGGAGRQSGLYLISEVYNLDSLRIRKLTPIECCRLQTVPDDFINGSGLSDNQMYSCLGDGWTVDIIAHILKGINNTN